MSLFHDFDSNFGDDGVHGHNHLDCAQADFHHGHFVIKAPNLEHGHDTFVDGHHTTHTANNVHGGQNIYHGHELAQITVPNAHGGIDVYDGHMHQEGSFLPDHHGGEDYLSSFGNGDAIMHYHDPLIHSAEYHMEPFNVAHHK